MTRHQLTLSMGMAIGLVSLTAIGFAGQPRPVGRQKAVLSKLPVASKPSGALPKPSRGHFMEIIPHEEPIVTEPVLPVTFKAVPSSSVQGPELEYHRRIARAMTSANLMTNHRMNHFRWLLNNPSYELKGWVGFITGIQPTPEGPTVTVRINPSFLSDGLSTLTLDYTLEKYTLVNGRFHFVEAIDPPDAIPGSTEMR